MRNFKLILDNMNVNPVLNVLNKNSTLWDEIILRQSFLGTPHRDTECIFIRGPGGFTREEYQEDIGSYDYPESELFLESLSPLFLDIYDELQVEEIGRILIVKLKPGGKITPHIDEGVYADYYSRFHIALTETPNSFLYSGNEKQHFQKGECWWFNHKEIHSAENLSNEYRIHIIFDLKTPLFKVGNGNI